MGSMEADEAFAEEHMPREFECAECGTKLRHRGTLADWNLLMGWHDAHCAKLLAARLAVTLTKRALGS